MKLNYIAVLPILSICLFIGSCSQPSSGGTCTSNCFYGQGIAQAGLFVEPSSGVAPVTNAIMQAQHTINIAVYMLTDKTVVHALEDAANRGVHVQVMLELHPFDSTPPTAVMDELQAAGIQVEGTNPAFPLTHEKVMIIDNATVYIMTANLSLSGLGGSSYGANRDYGIIDQQTNDVQTIENIFTADWNRSIPTVNDANIVVSPLNSRTDMTSFINAAQHTLWIESEEMNDGGIMQALSNAAHRGVVVELILPSTITGSNATNARQLTQSGVHVREDTALYMHAKMMLADNATAFVGSENFSAQSLDENREIGILLARSATTSTLASTFMQDWNASSSIKNL
jgi:phosphatidylserine/phosphatidylglycerophosphate/cardiolipin synthase-like enzyme